MRTSVHIPKDLLDAVDRRARELKLSRNGLIVRALEREVARPQTWSPGFFERLRSGTPTDAKVVDEMRTAIRAHRTRKGPPRL